MSLHQASALDVLIREVIAAPRQDVAMGRLVDAAHRVQQRADLVQSHLQFVLTSPDQLAEIARHAYWHVNGFVKIRLAGNSTFCLRLHIWPPGENRRGDTEPHSHRWDFASWIAVGPGLLETHFARTDSGDPAGNAHVHYDYGRPADHEPQLQSGHGVAWLRPVTTLQRTAGIVYDCAHSVVHTVEPLGSDLIATVLLQGPAVTGTTAVYRPYGNYAFRDLERPVGTSELAALIGAVDDALAG
jgi:hypothetical protein